MPWAIGVSILSQLVLYALLGLGATVACEVVALAAVFVWLVLEGCWAGSDTLTHDGAMKPR